MLFRSPSVSASSALTLVLDNTFALAQAVDRWWDISAPGFTATVTVSYKGSENTLPDSSAVSPLQINEWNGATWTKGLLSNKGVTSGIGTVTISNTNLFSSWMVACKTTTKGNNYMPVDTSGASADDLIIESLSPNPFTSQFNVSYTLYKGDPVVIQLADAYGKVFHRETVSGVTDINSYTYIDKYNLKPGIYLFYITYHGTTTTRKIVKN